MTIGLRLACILVLLTVTILHPALAIQPLPPEASTVSQSSGDTGHRQTICCETPRTCEEVSLRDEVGPITTAQAGRPLRGISDPMPATTAPSPSPRPPRA